MEKATIIRLDDSPPSTGTASFEEAFGEHSNAKGKGRAKRKARKLERIKGRGEVRAARRANKQAAVEDRQMKRATRVQARGQRKIARKTMRVERKAIGDEPELAAEQMPLETPETGYEQGYQEPVGDTGAGYVEEPQYASEPQAQETVDTSEEWGGGAYAPQEYFEEQAAGEEEMSEEFAGNDESSSFSSELNGNAVSPEIQEIANKIEWNKELLRRLKLTRDELQNSGQFTGDVDKRMAQTKIRIEQLTSQLSGFSGADGRRGGARVQAQINRAVTNARQARAAVAKGNVSANRVRQAEQVSRRRANGGSETEVDAELNPEITDNRVEVPGDESNASGTGLNGLDLQRDYDAPDARRIELTSSAEGKKINWKPIVIGSIIALGAIWAIRKYKLV